MHRVSTNGSFGLLWILPLSLIFLVGGIFQYIGILSQTQSNWLALIMFIPVLFTASGWKQIRYETLLLLFIGYIITDHFRHNLPLSYTLTYLYYVICTVIAAVAGRIYASRIAIFTGNDTFFKIIKIFLIIQLLVVSFQRAFTAQFIAFSRAPIGEIDAIFGTFFLQSDAALAAVCELLTISTFMLHCRARDRYTIASLSTAIIFLANSNTAKFAILFIIALLIIYDIYLRLGLGRVAFNLLLILGFILIASIMYNPASGWFSAFYNEASMDYYRRGSWTSAARFSPIGQIFSEGVHFFGSGALTYYNPITKTWLYNAGFSTFYSLYLDFGVLGLLLYYAYQILLVIKLTRSYFEFVIFICVFVLFAAFNFALTDMTFVLSFNLILNLNYLRGRSSLDMYRKRISARSIMEPKEIL
jgi:hypothetical protein